MSIDDLPPMSSRDDEMMSHVEHAGPFQRTYVLLNGFKVPHLTVSDRGDEVSLVVDHRLAFDVPKSHADTAVDLVAAVIAVERGYGCWPRSPADQFMAKAPPFGPVWRGVDIVAGEPEDGGA